MVNLLGAGREEAKIKCNVPTLPGCEIGMLGVTLWFVEKASMVEFTSTI